MGGGVGRSVWLDANAKIIYAAECNHGFFNSLELQLLGGKAHDGDCGVGNACVSVRISQVKGELIALDSPSASRRHAAQPIRAVELECVISAVGPNYSGVQALIFHVPTSICSGDGLHPASSTSAVRLPTSIFGSI